MSVAEGKYHSGHVFGVEYTRELIWSVGRDGSLVCMDWLGDLVYSLQPNIGALHCVALFPDIVACGSRNGAVMCFDFDPSRQHRP